MKSITGINRKLGKITVRVGDRVRFDTNSNLGIHEDVVRECFMQTTVLQPYAENLTFPAVVLTQHSWTPLSSLVAVIPKEPRAVQMHRSHTIDGVCVSFKRSICGWIACFGPERSVTFSQPTGSGWVARRRFALEPICVAQTLAAAVTLVKARYDAHDRETEARIAARLKGVA